MGFTRLPIKVKNPAKAKSGKIWRFLVDSGALYSVIPRKNLKKLGIKPTFKQKFTLANGEEVKWPVGNALFKYQEKEIASPVIFGEKDDIFLLGVTTLESFGYILDPVTRELKEVPTLLM